MSELELEAVTSKQYGRANSNDSGKTDDNDFDCYHDETVAHSSMLTLNMYINGATAPPPNDISFIRSFLRVFLVFCTALVAAFIPNIGLLVSLAGASSGTSLALIFPPLLEVLICRQQGVVLSTPRLLFCIASIGVGTIGAVLGTLISLSAIFSFARSQ